MSKPIYNGRKRSGAGSYFLSRSSSQSSSAVFFSAYRRSGNGFPKFLFTISHCSSSSGKKSHTRKFTGEKSISHSFSLSWLDLIHELEVDVRFQRGKWKIAQFKRSFKELKDLYYFLKKIEAWK